MQHLNLIPTQSVCQSTAIYLIIDSFLEANQQAK